MRAAVFTGSASGHSPAFARAAAAFGRDLAGFGVGIVYGGGRVGLMGVLADAALAAGGDVTGVMPRSLVAAEIAHPGLTELRVVESMHERKAAIAELADMFVALPGGAGTLDELFEVWTWQQLGLHDKPVGLLNPGGYWDPLLAALDHMSTAGFIRAADRSGLFVAGDATQFLDAVRSFTPPERKWDNHVVLPTVESVGWLCIRQQRLLAVRTRGRDALYLPGGKPEPGEPGPRALARELAEELHLTILPDQLTESFTVEGEAHAQAGRRLRMTCYTGPAVGEPLPGREIAEIAWVTRDDAGRCAPALRQVMERLAASGHLG
jgi:uncharacterized protein (TIGR00730 family)